ncbi:MAG: 5-oxoprolinase subunit C family protein [Sagittula sp.]|uniref:5-oxoprolinase subunit C family protein n=1 Tax=Sagittula sp. TaxID=2038081 RepID=UPI0040589689
MSGALEVVQAGPGLSLQDAGRPGWLAQGLSRGGAADLVALAEGAALLGQVPGVALEMAGMGGRFRATCDLRIALTGARMAASVDGRALRWNACWLLPADETLEIGAAQDGVYGYLSVGGGFDQPEVLGSQGAHLAAGIGRALEAGDRLALGDDAGGATGLGLEPIARLGGGVLRVLPSLQTEVFPEEMRTRFCAEAFKRDARGNRMGVRLVPEGEGFGLDAGGRILSEVIVPGDIQIPGDGAPYVLLSECQTTGGYPRIGTVIPADLPRIAQAAPGAEIRFRFVTRDEALAAERAMREALKGLPKKIAPLVRDPKDINLLDHNLVSGVTDGEVTR